MAAVALGLGVMATACSSGDEPGRPADDESTVTLKLNIAAVDPVAGEGSRATEFEQEASIREMIRTLRIIIVHDDPADASRKKVEFNQFWDLAGEAGADDKTQIAATASKEINVYAGAGDGDSDLKDIYVIANEHGLYSGYSRDAASTADRVLGSIDLSNAVYGSGAYLSGDDLERLEQLTFDFNHAADVKGLIPMSEHHQVTVRHPRIDEQGNLVDRDQSVNIFLTRALVKVTVKVTNKTSRPLELTGYRLTNMSPKSYLFPFETVYSPAKELCQSEAAVAPREITAYSTPSQTPGTFERKFSVLSPSATPADRQDPYAMDPIAAGDSRTLPAVYMPESKAGAGFAVNLSLFGAYQVSDKTLDGLSGSLPRNTHLYIEATVSDMEVKYEVWVHPYREVELKPGFGLPKK